VTQLPGVSFIVPVRNGARWLDEALAAILAQRDGRPMEVLLIEDGSTDGSRTILEGYADGDTIRIIDGEKRGAAAAINLGLRSARYPIVCQVDQDVIVQPGWMATLVSELDNPDVAAAGGYYLTDERASFWARAMGFELMQRYDKIAGRFVDHVCTGNTAYRLSALTQVGLFDESFGYGYDNDLSYRLGAAGHRLAFSREARALHRWREDAGGYLQQQYGFGFGRIDLIDKHRNRYKGDDVSGLFMILHAPLMLLALCALTVAGALAVAHVPWRIPALIGSSLIGALAIERLFAGLAAVRRMHNGAGYYFVPVHLSRDIAWAAAIVAWCFLRLIGRRRQPRDSMR
jgi:glycosyltransferase involved in cell wall biosynthesis